MPIPKWHFSQYRRLITQNTFNSSANFNHFTGKSYIKNEVNKLLQNPLLEDNIYRFCVTANNCSISPQLRIILSDLVPKNVNLKFTNSKDLLNHKKFSISFVLKSLSKLPSLLYTTVRTEENPSEVDLTTLDTLSLDEVLILSLQLLTVRYSGKINDHIREISEIFDSFLNTSKFVANNNLSLKYSYLNSSISSFATKISNDIVTTFYKSKYNNIYPLIFTVGKFLEIHGIQNKELYNIIYNAITNPDKWILFDYEKSNYTKFFLDSITKLLQFRLPQDNIDKIINYLIVSDILPLNHWSTIFIHLSRFGFNRSTIDLALMAFIRKYKYCKFPIQENEKEKIDPEELQNIPAVTDLVKSIDLTTKNVYFNISGTITTHGRTFTNIINLEPDYTFNIISGITNIKRRIKLSDATNSYIDQVLEILWPRVSQMLPIYIYPHLSCIAEAYIDLIFKRITAFSNLGYSTKQRGIVESIILHIMKFKPIFSLKDYINSLDLVSKIHCNIEYNSQSVDGKFIANELLNECIKLLLNGELLGLTLQENILSLDFHACVRLSHQLVKYKENGQLDFVDSEKYNELIMLLKEAMIPFITYMNQDHRHANSKYLVLLNLISLHFKGISQLLESLNVSNCIKLLSIDDKIDILRLVTGQSVKEQFLTLLIDRLEKDLISAPNKLQISKCILILRKVLESLEKTKIDTFLLITIPNISSGHFIAELLDLSNKLEATNDISKQFIEATINNLSNAQLNLNQLRHYLKCCRLVGKDIDINKFMDIPLHNSDIPQIESVLSEVRNSRVCDEMIINRFVDWSIHLFTTENEGLSEEDLRLSLTSFANILSHLFFFNISHSKLLELSISLLNMYYKQYPIYAIHLLNAITKFKKYPERFKDIYKSLLEYTDGNDQVPIEAYRQLYDIYVRALPTDNSMHSCLEMANLLKALEVPSYHWFNEQEQLGNEFKMCLECDILLKAISKATGITPKTCAINPYFVHYILEDTHDEKYNNMVILVITDKERIYGSNTICGDALAKIEYFKKLGYKVLTVDIEKVKTSASAEETIKTLCI